MRWIEFLRAWRYPEPEPSVLDPEAVFMRRVLKIFADAHAHEDLLWVVGDSGRVLFSVNVSDTFEWGIAEIEHIMPRDLHLLREAFEDLKVLEAPGTGAQRGSRTVYVGMLYAARKRARRPMLRAYPKLRDVGALLDACGPLENA